MVRKPFVIHELNIMSAHIFIHQSSELQGTEMDSRNRR